MDQATLGTYLEILTAENQQISDLLESGRRKRRAIIGNHIDRLDQLVAEETGYLRELQRLEILRAKTEVELAKIWELPGEERLNLNAVAMLEVIERREPQRLKFFRGIIDLIKKNMLRLQELNQENQELTALALDYVDEMQQLILGEENAGLYSGAGETLDDMPRPTLKLIDKKV
jgi:hypothetical protein